MGPPGGGRQIVTNRFLRYFSFISFPELEDASMTQIFRVILHTFVDAYLPADVLPRASADDRRVARPLQHAAQGAPPHARQVALHLQPARHRLRRAGRALGQPKAIARAGRPHPAVGAREPARLPRPPRQRRGSRVVRRSCAAGPQVLQGRALQRPTPTATAASSGRRWSTARSRT